MNGIPTLTKGKTFAGREKAMLDEFRGHSERVDGAQGTLINRDGVIGNEELFAKLIVTYIKVPQAWLREGPTLYTQPSEPRLRACLKILIRCLVT